MRHGYGRGRNFSHRKILLNMTTRRTRNPAFLAILIVISIVCVLLLAPRNGANNHGFSTVAYLDGDSVRHTALRNDLWRIRAVPGGVSILVDASRTARCTQYETTLRVQRDTLVIHTDTIHVRPAVCSMGGVNRWAQMEKSLPTGVYAVRWTWGERLLYAGGIGVSP
jgi:hypothetical protein